MSDAGVRVPLLRSRWVRLVAFPGLKIETWGTHFAEVGKAGCFPAK